jgi:carboxyl-terminal processing protease
MRRTTRTLAALRLSLAALALLAAVDVARAQSSAGPSDETAALQDLLRQGTQLESQQRWGDALTLYEDAVRKFPSQPHLQRRFEYTRMHYDLGRRYHDPSFLSLIASLPLDEALDVYLDVLGKVQTYYVEAPQWKQLVDCGLSGLEVALSEAEFQSRHGLTGSGPAVDSLRAELRQSVAATPVPNREAARAVVESAARLAQRRLAINPSAVVLEFTCGATNALDTYSTYLTPAQLSELYSQIEGNFVGLGVELKADQGTLLIVRVIRSSPAEQAGIKPGDRIVAVDGQQTTAFSTDQAANLLQGPEGSSVRLRMQGADGQTREVAARRTRVDVPSIEDVKIVDAGQGVGYLKLSCFQKTTTRDLDEALWSLHRAGMRSLIMDLRGNPGGLLVTAVEVADKFLEQGVIVSTHGRVAQEDFTYRANQPGTWRMPLVVLIDQDSASAAEIFAGAIRDHRRGTVVGQRSYGKGSVQGIFPLSTGTAGVRLTTAKFYSPSGDPYSGVGVKPDLEVYQAARPVAGAVALASTEDACLAAALQAVRQGQMAKR